MTPTVNVNEHRTYTNSTAPPACSLLTILLLAQMYKLYILTVFFHFLYILPVVTIVAVYFPQYCPAWQLSVILSYMSL